MRKNATKELGRKKLNLKYHIHGIWGKMLHVLLVAQRVAALSG